MNSFFLGVVIGSVILFLISYARDDKYGMEVSMIIIFIGVLGFLIKG